MRIEVSQPVADIQDPCILDTDFLEPLGCVVNLKDGVLSIGDEEVPLRSNKSLTSNPPRYCTVINETMTYLRISCPSEN